jgi:Outer membrane protein beta-barrel domain
MKIMKAKYFIVVMLIVGIATLSYAQSTVDTTSLRKGRWDKKFFFGATFNTSWAKITGSNLPVEYFWRPTTGASLRAEYFFHKYIGVSIGLQYQQRGSGIVTPDFVKTLGDPDSTYRARIKMVTVEVPICLVVRSGEIIKGVRLHASGGISPVHNFESKFTRFSVEDGFHVKEVQNERYYKNDFAFIASAGFDINAANATIFQIHFYGSWGTKNVFNPTAFPGADGRNNVLGFRLGWMF